MPKLKNPHFKFPALKIPLPLVKAKDRQALFICQITESHLKLIKCQLTGKKREFTGLEIEPITADIEEKKLSQRLTEVSKKLGYNNNPVVVCLPRGKVTSRYLKVPTQEAGEIEDIISLQASRYLPYPSNELITAYQILSVDKEGYSEINLTIMHKDVAQRYIKAFNELKPCSLSIVLNSYGLLNFYEHLKADEPDTQALIMDVDGQQIELIIAKKQKLLFSRNFKIDKNQSGWEGLLLNEVRKSQDAYLKELAKERPEKIFLSGSIKPCKEFASALSKELTLPVECLSYDKIGLSKETADRLLTLENSFSGLIGLGLKDLEDSLNLLPKEAKEKARAQTQRRQALTMALSIAGIVLILGLGIARHLANKEFYLKKIKIELNRLSKDAATLEEIEKRFKFMQRNLQKKPTSLEVLSELHRVMPANVSLVNFSYLDLKEMLLRGEARELNSVLVLVTEIEKSAVFKNFRPRLRYATQKKTASGELVSFEIACSKGK